MFRIFKSNILIFLTYFVLAHRETKEIIAKGLLYHTIFKCPPFFLDYLKNKRKIYFIWPDFEHAMRVCLVNDISINTTWPDFSSFWPEREQLIQLDSDRGRVWWSLWRLSRLPTFHHPGDVRFWDFYLTRLKVSWRMFFSQWTLPHYDIWRDYERT